MKRPVTIVMYHYVRELDGSRFPDLKALTVEQFRSQLDYIDEFYTVVSMQEVVDAVTEGAPLPDRAILLTFDDGVRDHYDNVFPILRSRGLPAAFFPSSRPVLEGRVLDVHKIHLILASAEDAAGLLDELDQLLEDEGVRDRMPDQLSEVVEDSHRYDKREVTAFKRLLQRELPRELRERLVDQLFRSHVTEDEEAFCREFYMSNEELREMMAAGMYIGGHGHAHLWLDRVGPEERETELERTMAFLRNVGALRERWVMCYPYGATSPCLMEELKERGCAVGLLAEPGIADVARDAPLKLPRLDTNDLPQEPVDVPNRWTRAVRSA